MFLIIYIYNLVFSYYKRFAASLHNFNMHPQTRAYDISHVFSLVHI